MFLLFLFVLHQATSVENQGILAIRSNHLNDSRTLTFTFFITCNHSNTAKDSVEEDSVPSDAVEEQCVTDDSKVISNLQETIGKDSDSLKWFYITEIVDHQECNPKNISNDAVEWACQIFTQGKVVTATVTCRVILAGVGHGQILTKRANLYTVCSQL
jgi:hypothetical protein